MAARLTDSKSPHEELSKSGTDRARRSAHDFTRTRELNSLDELNTMTNKTKQKQHSIVTLRLVHLVVMTFPTKRQITLNIAENFIRENTSIIVGSR